MFSNLRKTIQNIWLTIMSIGIVSIVFGLVAMIWPKMTLHIFIYLFSIFIMLSSIIFLSRSLSTIQTNRLWWLSSIFAIIGISMSFYVLLNPSVAQDFIAILMAVYIFSQSILDLVLASYSDNSKTKVPMIAVGVVGIVFGFIILSMPELATEAMVWTIGLYILAHGLFIEYYAIKTKSSFRQFEKTLNPFSSKESAKEAKVIKTRSTKKSIK